MEFYDAVSQVIPVLVVALVADAGRFGRKVGSSGSFILAIMLGIVGESTALAAIQRGHGNALMLWTVWLSMAWMAAILIWPHVNEQGRVVRSAYLRVPPNYRYLAGQVGFAALAAPVTFYWGASLPVAIRFVLWFFAALALAAFLTRAVIVSRDPERLDGDTGTGAVPLDDLEDLIHQTAETKAMLNTAVLNLADIAEQLRKENGNGGGNTGEEHRIDVTDADSRL
jgi:hypothetical protein